MTGATSPVSPKRNDVCSVAAQTDSQSLWSGSATWTATTPNTVFAVNASGTLTATATYLQIYVYCTGNFDANATIDDVVFYTFTTVTSPNAIVAVPKQVLTNNDFSAGTTNWTFSGTTTRSTFAVINGRATITFSQISNTYSTPSYLEQVAPLLEATQSFSLSADVFVTIPVGSVSCYVSFVTGNVEFWSMSGVTSSQTYSVRNVRAVAAADSQYFYFYSTCTGTAVCTTAIDNVYLTYNT